MAENEIEKFVIIDDMELDCFPGKVIQTAMETGLTEEYVDKIVEILNG